MIFSLCKQIGIKTFGDLARFEREYKKDNEDLELALMRYLLELGFGFKVVENENNI